MVGYIFFLFFQFVTPKHIFHLWLLLALYMYLCASLPFCMFFFSGSTLLQDLNRTEPDKR